MVLRHFLIAAVTLFLVACQPAATFNTTDLSSVDWGKDFALTDHHGKPRRLADFKGKVVVMFFGYTQCPDVCPTNMTAMREVMALLGADAARVQMLFVTVDPARDTQALLAEYVPAFDKSFLGLHGDADAVKTVAKEFKIFYHVQPGSTPTNYTVDHSAGSYVLDAQGKLRLYIKHGETPVRIAEDLKRLLAAQ